VVSAADTYSRNLGFLDRFKNVMKNYIKNILLVASQSFRYASVGEKRIGV
jgi:hypothetical protein